jgi:hypothetical protein
MEINTMHPVRNMFVAILAISVTAFGSYKLGMHLAEQECAVDPSDVVNFQATPCTGKDCEYTDD